MSRITRVHAGFARWYAGRCWKEMVISGLFIVRFLVFLHTFSWAACIILTGVFLLSVHDQAGHPGQ